MDSQKHEPFPTTGMAHGMSLYDYWRAPSCGPLHDEWEDKPHRLLYDLVGEISVTRAAAREALDVLTRLADSAAYWSDYDVPVGIVAEINAAKARLAGVLNG